MADPRPPFVSQPTPSAPPPPVIFTNFVEIAGGSDNVFWHFSEEVLWAGGPAGELQIDLGSGFESPINGGQNGDNNTLSLQYSGSLSPGMPYQVSGSSVSGVTVAPGSTFQSDTGTIT